MNEISRADFCLNAVMTADAAFMTAVSNFYVQVPPQPATQEERDALFPYGLATYQSAIDVQGVSTERTMTRLLYQVVVVYQGAPDDAVFAAADRIDEVVGRMRNVALALPNGETWVFNGRREAPLVLTKPDDSVGLYFERRGGLYRIDASRG